MAATNFRTEKLLKELKDLFQKRLECFEDIKFFSLQDDQKQVKYLYGKCVGLKRAIHDILVTFDLIDTELYQINNSRFELDYLAENEEEKESLTE